MYEQESLYFSYCSDFCWPDRYVSLFLFSIQPLKVTTPRGSDYLLQYDEAGALQSLTTPRGHIHAFSLQTSLGFFKYQYYSPVNRHPFEILYNDDGQIIAKVYPHQSGRVAYVYDQTGKLDTVLAGKFLVVIFLSLSFSKKFSLAHNHLFHLRYVIHPL